MAHERVLAEAAARRVALALAPYGVLGREHLRRAAGADHWRGTSFQRALDEAVELGLIDRRPLGFYRRHVEAPAAVRDRAVAAIVTRRPAGAATRRAGAGPRGVANPRMSGSIGRRGRAQRRPR